MALIRSYTYFQIANFEKSAAQVELKKREGSERGEKMTSVQTALLTVVCLISSGISELALEQLGLFLLASSVVPSPQPVLCSTAFNSEYLTSHALENEA